MHEVLSVEVVGAIANRIRRVIARTELHDLKSRLDLNGQAAEVIGPLNERSGRVPVRIDATGETVQCKLANAFSAGVLPTVLECGAGTGALSHFLAEHLAGFAEVIAADDHRDKLAAGGTIARVVSQLDSERAIRQHDPCYVVIAWQPSGIDWTLHCREEGASCREYLLLGEPDGSTCGDGWATWGVVPENGDEYGLDEDSTKPYVADGFTRVELPEIARWQLCRFDSGEARGFSTAVAFTRRGCAPTEGLAETEPEESLAESWQRMQRSVEAGTAQRLDVQMDVSVTK